MSASTRTRMTADAFIAWAMQQPEGTHYELEAGEVVAMAPERSLHALTKARLHRGMDDAVARSGRPCTAYPDGMAVFVDEHTVCEPYALVRCGPALPGDAALVTDPVIVVEVRSPATEARDSGVKLVDYFRIPSVRHYLIVVAHERTVIHHARGQDGRIATATLRDAPVPLDPPGIVLDGFWPASTPP